jgi:TRAP-type C4-dicarboxylate transport system permease small subunit
MLEKIAASSRPRAAALRDRAGAGCAAGREDVAAGLLGVMFVAFVVQIAFRYLFNFPVGWTSELSVVMWLYLVLWGTAFVLKERDEIRFDLLYAAVGRRTRIAMAIVSRSRSWCSTAPRSRARSTT